MPRELVEIIHSIYARNAPQDMLHIADGSSFAEVGDILLYPGGSMFIVFAKDDSVLSAYVIENLEAVEIIHAQTN